jgi:GxxExxY protein
MSGFEFRARQSSQVSADVEELTEKVIGAAIEVHRHLGPGLPEVAYRNALSHELRLQQIPHVWEAPVPIMYKGVKVAEGRLDLLVCEELIVEIKVVESLSPVHRAQALSYLCATKLQLALLINFNVAILKDGIKRVINTI